MFIAIDDVVLGHREIAALHERALDEVLDIFNRRKEGGITKLLINRVNDHAGNVLSILFV